MLTHLLNSAILFKQGEIHHISPAAPWLILLSVTYQRFAKGDMTFQHWEHIRDTKINNLGAFPL